MKRETVLTILVVLLLLINACTLAFLFTRHRHGPPPPARVDKIIIETLDWNKEQQAQFQQLKHEHRSTMNRLDAQNEAVAKKYFSLLNTAMDDSAQKDSLEKLMAQVEVMKADVTFRHFEDLKRICTPEQAKNFDILVPQLIQILIPPQPKGGPHPK